MQNTQTSSGHGGSNSNFCSGSWGKDFYLQYDVCPLALDELDTYFRAEKCAELIRERFKILDVDLAPEPNCSGTETLIQEQSTISSTGEGTIRNIDSSCSSPSDKEQNQRTRMEGGGAEGDDEDDDDDAGHHSGKKFRKFVRIPSVSGIRM